MANAVFFENTALDAGGAIYFEYKNTTGGTNSDSLELGDCTFVKNDVRQPGAGAGVHLAVVGSGTAGGANDPHLEVFNSIMWENVDGVGADIDVMFVGSGFTADVQYSNFSLTFPSSVVGYPAFPAGTSTSTTSVNPVFVDIAAGNLRLSNGLGQVGGGGGAISPLIDQGLDSLLNVDLVDIDGDGTFGILIVDLDFRDRKIDFPFVSGPGFVDLGAFEAEVPLFGN